MSSNQMLKFMRTSDVKGDASGAGKSGIKRGQTKIPGISKEREQRQNMEQQLMNKSMDTLQFNSFFNKGEGQNNFQGNHNQLINSLLDDENLNLGLDQIEQQMTNFER